MADLVEIDQLRKEFGRFVAVEEISMRVQAGEIIALLGPNGAGKTTTIRMLMGILQPTYGSARIAGFDCFSEREQVMRRVGYLPDEPAFYDYLRGSELISFVSDMHGLRGKDHERNRTDLIERFDLGDAMGEFAVNYSTGMKKKLALICAMLHKPSLLILDEPTNGLDPISTRTLLATVRNAAESGTSVFYSTHLLDQAEKLCDRVGIMHKGKLAAEGPLIELRDTLTPGGSLEDLFFEVAGDGNTPDSELG